MKKTNNSKELKLHFKFNNNISEEESDRILFQVFDILLNDNDKKSKDE